MIVFHELRIGSDSRTYYGVENPCPRCARRSSAGKSPDLQTSEQLHRYESLLTRMEELSESKASVMIQGSEPFRHPDLVDIIQALAGSNIRRLGIRTEAAALVNPQDAQGCIDNGVRVFEIPLLPREMDSVVMAAPFEARIAGLRGIRSAAANLGADVFVSAHMLLCTHTAAYFPSTVQAVIAAGFDALRLGLVAAKPSELIDALGGVAALDFAQSAATQNSLAFFLDGDEAELYADRYLKAAQLYSVVAQDKVGTGEKGGD